MHIRILSLVDECSRVLDIILHLHQLLMNITTGFAYPFTYLLIKEPEMGDESEY